MATLKSLKAETDSVDAETKRRIEKKARKILGKSNLYQTSEYKVRELASEQLGLDLSEPQYKGIVTEVVESFLEEEKAREDAQRAEQQKALAEFVARAKAKAEAKAKSKKKQEETDDDEEDEPEDEDESDEEDSDEEGDPEEEEEDSGNSEEEDDDAEEEDDDDED